MPKTGRPKGSAPARKIQVMTYVNPEEYATINAARAAAAEPYLSAFVREAVLGRGRVAWCLTCGEVTACDEDRCCATCGRDLIVLADRHSAEVLDEGLQEMAGRKPTIADVRAAAEREHRIAVGKCPNCNVGLTSLGRCDGCGYDEAALAAAKGAK